MIDHPKFRVLDNVEATQSQEPIRNYILAVTPHRAAGVLKDVKHRLRPDSTILLLSWDVGLMEKVKKEVFPDPNIRPNLLVGTLTHRVVSVAKAQ